uniref:Uncharacterized protein n=1 Tax=Fagus sylvatica TaxID=28930 RepID=A0A2N9HZM7_FAGSY
MDGSYGLPTSLVVAREIKDCWWVTSAVQGQRRRKRLLGEIGAGVVKSRPVVLVARDDSGGGGLRSVLGSWDRGHRHKGLSTRAGGGTRMVAAQGVCCGYDGGLTVWEAGWKEVCSDTKLMQDNNGK